MKKLPIGIQTFSEIRDENYYYIDKTQILFHLVESGKYYFLSRPRRFGKSLFLDTIKEAFEGSQKFFKGLYLENNWDWSRKYPVIKIDFSAGVLNSAEKLEEKIREILLGIVETYDLKELNRDSISGIFSKIIQILHEKYNNKVVVLIDEYDKPILDNITNTEVALQMRDGLRNLYSVIKSSDAHIKFVFITGVSKFSKVNLFSGLNNLEDISLNPNFATICGYTEKEIEIFSDLLIDVDRNELKRWYNGYNFLGDKVYNPFDILFFLKNKTFQNYWCETGNPTFLIDLIQKKQYPIPSLEKIKLSSNHLASFDIENITIENLLFQTGYLTIDSFDLLSGSYIYNLKFPNLEVRQTLTDTILNLLSNSVTPKENNKISLREHLTKINPEGLKSVFHSFFASIPHDWYRKNHLASYEAYYASIFYCYFAALGMDVRPEDVTNHGQVDMVVFLESKVYVFEFKVIELTEKGSALAQIKEKKYYEKYSAEIHKDTDIFLIGVEFSREERNITNFEWEKVQV